MKFFKLTKNPNTSSDNFKVGDKVFFDTLYEFQEEDLGFNYNRGILKEIKHLPSNNREYYIVQTDDGKLLQVGNVFHTEEEKDNFNNNWMNPKFEKQSAITRPNKPKPTTMLPDNMEWAWDPDAADWVAVLKDNDNTTPPLYDPNNQNVVNNTTTYMSNIKSASVIDGEEDEDPLSVKLSDLFLSDSSLIDSYIKKEISCDDIINILGIEIKNKNEYKEVCNYVKEFINDNYMSNIKSSCLSKFLDGPQYSKEIKIEAGLIKEGLVKYAGFDFNRGTKYTITDKGLEVLRKASEKEHNEALNEREKLAYMFGFNTDKETTLDTTGKVIKSDDKPNKIKKINIESLKNKLYRAIKNDRKGLDDALDYVNIRIKNEEGGVTVYVSDELSYDGLTKLANVINKVVQEIDKDAYFEPLDSGTLVSFVSDGTPLNFDASLHKTAKRWTICEADGSELGKVTASSKLDAKVKFGIEHPEYADSQSISAKEIKAEKLPLYKQKDPYYSDEAQISLFKTSINDVKRNFEQIAGIPLKQFCLIYKENNNEEFKKIYDKITDYISKKYNYNVKSMQWFHSFCDMIENKCNKKDAQYEQTTNTKEPYPNPSETPHDDIVLENHDGWVNTAGDVSKKSFENRWSFYDEYFEFGNEGTEQTLECSIDADSNDYLIRLYHTISKTDIGFVIIQVEDCGELIIDTRCIATPDRVKAKLLDIFEELNLTGKINLPPDSMLERLCK